jgi:hypothetical protein
VVRFVARYRTVLKLPDTLRTLISSPSGYGQAAREYRKAQRVLRGAAGPVFREVLTELEDVAARWKASLYNRLATEYVGSSGSSEHVVEATRALRELGSLPEPGVYFSQQQMMFALNRVNSSGSSALEVLHEALKLLPALRLAYSKLGAGSADGVLHAGVWGSCLEQCTDAVKLAVKDGTVAGELLVEAQRFRELIADCLQGVVGGKERQPCYSTVGNLILWLQQKVASHIRQDCLRFCGSNSDPLPTIIQSIEKLMPVMGETAANEAGLVCLCKAVDLIVQNCDAALKMPFAPSWSESLLADKDSPEDMLLECAGSAKRLLSNGTAAVSHRSATDSKSKELFAQLCASARERALRGYVARMAYFARRIVSNGTLLEVQEEFQRQLDGKGAVEETVYAPANQYSSVAPIAHVEKSLLSDWALEVVQLLIVVRSHLDGRLSEESAFVMKSLAELVVGIVEDIIDREREVIGKNLAARFACSIRFLSDVLGFSENVHLLANFLVLKVLKVKMPNSLEKAALLRRCFTPDEGQNSVRSETKSNRTSGRTSPHAGVSPGGAAFAAAATKRAEVSILKIPIDKVPEEASEAGRSSARREDTKKIPRNELVRPNPAVPKKEDRKEVPIVDTKKTNPFDVRGEFARPSPVVSKKEEVPLADAKKATNPFESKNDFARPSPVVVKKEVDDSNPFGVKKDVRAPKKTGDKNPFGEF